MGIQGDRQHEPESFQGCQLATSAPFIVESSPAFEHGHQGGVSSVLVVTGEVLKLTRMRESGGPVSCPAGRDFKGFWTRAFAGGTVFWGFVRGSSPQRSRFLQPNPRSAILKMFLVIGQW